MRKSIMRIFVIIGLFFCIPFIAKATTFSDDYSEDGQSIIDKILGSGLTATNVVKKGTIYTFSNGTSDFGIDSGIILDTSGNVENIDNDSDLALLMDYPYGGHTSSLEFTMIAEGELLNFNYVFASGEFGYGPQYNDIFGLFVSVNDGPYENIAKIKNDNDQEFPVNITNLKNNPSLYNVKNISINGETTDGVSNVFNAQKQVKKGDNVKIKFVIADVSDDSVNSYVMIESGSLSFDPPNANLDYKCETLKGLDPNTTYKIVDGKKTYEITSNNQGKIPLVGKDNNNYNYNFIGKTIQVIKKGIGDIPDSEPQNVVINDRPKTQNIEILSVTEDSITVQKINNYEYSIDGGSTWQKEPTFTGLEANKEYSIMARYAATNDTVHGTVTSSLKIKTLVKESSVLDNLPNVSVSIDLDNDLPIVSLSKGRLYESVKEDLEIKNAINNYDKVDLKFIVKSIKFDSSLAQAIKGNLKEYEKIAFTFDATIKLYINDGYIKDIKEPIENITFKINIPNNYIKKGRKFYAIRNHINSLNELEIERLNDNDSNDSTITISSNKFSDFVVTYVDDVIESKANIVNNKKVTVNNPKTGDNIMIYTYLFIFSINILMGCLICLRKNN